MRHPIMKTIAGEAISIAADYSLAAQVPTNLASNGNNIVKVASGNPDATAISAR